MLRKEGLSEKKEKRNIREDKAQVQREKLEAEQAKKREEESSSRARKPKLIGVHAEGNLRNAMFSTLGRLPTPITGKELGGHSQEREDRSVFIRVELLPR